MILLWIAGLFVLLLILCYIIYQRYRLQHHIQDLYKKIFHHPPDDVTLDRWMHNWKGDQVFYEFARRIVESRRRAKKERILFTGLCQDHGDEIIPHWLPRIEHLGEYFEDYRILIMENDSDDDTRERWIQETYRNPRVLVLCDDERPLNIKECRLGVRSSTGDKEQNLRRRVDRLANLRDTYLRRIGRKWADYEYMVVIDWDLIGDLSLEGFFHALSGVRDRTADVMTVNSLYRKPDGIWRIFDTFPLLNHHRCDELQKKKRQLDAETERTWRDRLTKTLREPVQMESAFGGLAIYSLPRVIETRSYYAIPEHEKRCPIQCEHTSFHRFLRVYIDPWFVLLLRKNLH